MEKFLIAMLVGFALGLFFCIISPRLYRRYFARKKILIDRPALILIFIVLIAATAFSWQTTQYNAPKYTKAQTNEYVQKPYPVYDSQYDLVDVLGQNTVDVGSNGKFSRIQLIGVDGFNGNNTEQNSCFAKEANVKLNEYLTGKKIELEADPIIASPSDNMLSRYLIVNNENINKKLIAEGYAKALNSDYQYRSEFLDAESKAKTNKAGIWSETICRTIASNLSQEKNNPSNPKQPQEKAPEPTPAPPANGNNNTSNPPSQPCPSGLPIITPVLNGLLNRC